MAVRQRRASLSVVLAAALLVGVLSALASIHATAHEALRLSVRADYAGFRYVAQAATPEAARALRALEGVEPLSSRPTELFTSTHRASGTLHLISNPSLAWGLLVEGARPKQGQIALFEATAQALEVRLGDAVRVGDERNNFEISGILVDPADGSRAGALIADREASSGASVFISQESFVAYRELAPYFAERQVTMRSTEQLLGDVVANLPTLVSTIDSLILPGAGVSVLVLAIVVALVIRGRDADRRHLISAGAPPQGELANCGPVSRHSRRSRGSDWCAGHLDPLALSGEPMVFARWAALDGDPTLLYLLRHLYPCFGDGMCAGG